MFGCNLDKEEFPPENYQAIKTIISIALPRCVEILFISLLIYLFYLPYLHGVTFLHDVMSYLAKVKSVDSQVLSLLANLLDALLW